MRISILLLPLLTLLFTVTCIAEPEAAPAVGSNSKSAIKSNDKATFPKKVTSLKKRPTKSSTIAGNSAAAAKVKKSLSATVFKNLTADDLEFIKELDHQFSVHGDKIKIKVERTNSTENKNPKRTIDGELGYGYSHNGYEYERPKFMFYPYSQKDIAADSPGYYPKTEHTSVTIEPSYSYELKPQAYEAPHQPQVDLPTPDVAQYSAHTGGAVDSHQPQQQQYEEPVIVLRIPGPAKYASHLQSLLQQYLEIRAAQYLRILENSELQQHPQPEQHVDYQLQEEHAGVPQQYVEQPQQHVEYQAPQAHEDHAVAPQAYEQAPQHNDHADYHQEVAYAHQVATTPQPISYAAIDDVYHNYKERHQQQQHPHQQAEAYVVPAQQPLQEQQYYHQPETSYHGPTADVIPQYYYMHDQHYGGETPHSADGGSNAQSYQHVYVIAMSTPQQHYGAPELSHQHQHHMQQPIYVPDEHQQSHANDQEQHFAITENSPRQTHTKVFFSTHSSEQNSHEYSPMHRLPSIRPYERYAPVSTPTYQHQQHAEESAPSAAAAVSGAATADQHAEEYQQGLVPPAPAAAPQHEVAITQRPHNYHAHPHKPKGRTRISAKRDASLAGEEHDKHLEEIHAYVTKKLGAKMGSQEAFKTTKIIDG